MSECQYLMACPTSCTFQI